MKISDPNEIKEMFKNYSGEKKYEYLKILQNLKNIDFSRAAEFDHELINLLIWKCISTITRYSNIIKLNGNFELMQYSIFRHYVNKIAKIVSPLFQIRFAPKNWMSGFFIELKYQDIVKYYYFMSGSGLVEIKAEAFFDKMKYVDSNDSDLLEYIPLTEMEF